LLYIEHPKQSSEIKESNTIFKVVLSIKLINSCLIANILYRILFIGKKESSTRVGVIFSGILGVTS